MEIRSNDCFTGGRLIGILIIMIYYDPYIFGYFIPSTTRFFRGSCDERNFTGNCKYCSNIYLPKSLSQPMDGMRMIVV